MCWKITNMLDIFVQISSTILKRKKESIFLGQSIFLGAKKHRKYSLPQVIPFNTKLVKGI